MKIESTVPEHREEQVAQTVLYDTVLYAMLVEKRSYDEQVEIIIDSNKETSFKNY